MSPDQWLAQQDQEPPKETKALSPDEWLAAQQKETSHGLSPEAWLASQPQQQQQGEAKTSNPFKGLVARGAQIAGEGIEGVARTAEAIGDKLELAMPLTNLTPEQVKTENQLQPLFDFSKNLKDWGNDVGYAPSTKLGELPGNPLKVVPFVAERIISSSPDMVAAVGATVPYIVSRTNEILNDRLVNDEKNWKDATVADIGAAASAAVLETYMEKFATKHLMPGAGPEAASVAGRVGKELAIQSGTEAVEEGVGYLGGTAGTKAGVDPEQMALQMIEGAIVGGGLGAGVQGVKEYAGTRPEIRPESGAGESGIQMPSTQREAAAGVGGPDQARLDAIRERLTELDGRKSTINDQLVALENQKAVILEHDPSDPRVGDIDETIKELKAEAKGVASQAQEVQASAKEKVFNAPNQLGLDFTEATPETKRTLATTPQEFGLTAPEGNVGVTTEAKPIEVPQYETSKFGFVGTGVSPIKNLTSFFSGIKPIAQTEGESKAHAAEVKKLLEDVNEFQNDATGKDRAGRLKALQSFFDQYSIAPADKQQAVSKLPQELVGMDAEAQQQALSEISQLPKINSVRGMKELRGQLEQAMLDYSEAKLGRARESAILPWQSHEDVSTRKDAAELQRLGNIAEKYMSPEEKAAKTYLTAHADYGTPFGSAMRAAAFDLGADQGPVFPGQTKETAQLFRNWAAKNLNPATVARFDATVNEFRQMGEKISKRTQEAEAAQGKGAGAPSKRTPSKANGTGFGRIMHPSIESKIANNDLDGALMALSQVGSKWQQDLAKRLRSLGLNTDIGYGKQDTFAKNVIETNAGSERAQLITFLNDAFPDVAKEHFNNMDDIKATFKSISDLRDGKLGVPKQTLEAYYGQLEAVHEAYQAGVAILDASGTYLTNSDQINLNRDKGGNNPWTFLHEVAHAATHWALDPRNYESLTKEQKVAVAELERTYKIARELWKSGNEISSLDEFVVEAFSNPEFQRFLKDVPMPNQKATFWNKFTDTIKNLFGLGNVLGYTLANANTLLQAPPSQSAEARALNQQGKLGGYLLDDTFKAGPESRSLVSNIFKGREGWNEVKDQMPAMLEGAKDSSRKHLLGGLTLRQIQDIVGPRIPPFKTFINRMEAMLDQRNGILNETRDIVKPWQAFQSKNPQKAKVLNALMLDSTRLGIDPAVNTKDATLNRGWDEIGEEGQRIYKQVRDFYKNQLDSHIQALLDRKQNSLVAKGMTPGEARTSEEYRALEKHFRDHSIEPYFPIRRFGQYWMQVGKGKAKEFYMFESARERNAFQTKREAQLSKQGSDKTVTVGNSLKSLVNDNIENFEFLKKLKELVSSETGSTRQELKDNITDSIEQLYLMTLPDQSIRKMFMNREGVQGMNQDMLRSFTASAFRIAYQQSRFKHSDGLYNAVDGAEAVVEGMTTNERKVYGDYIGELEKRLQYIMNPPDTGKIPALLSNISFVWYMTSPASALVNMLGVPAVGIPVVGARYGNGKTAAMMTSYAKKFATTGFKDADGKWSFPSLANRPDLFNDRQQAAFNQFIADGLIDLTLTHDIVGLSETPSNLYTGRTQKVMQVLSAAFHGAEKFNREVVAMSAYDLAYEKAKKNGLGDDAAQRKAVEEAKELTYRSMFDYSALNKPRFFQPAYAKVFLQFKQFSQQMTYLLARSAYEGFYKKFDAKEIEDVKNQINATRMEDGLNPVYGDELQKATEQYIKDFRSEGKKRLMGTLGTTFLFAGTTGLPGWAAFSALMEVLHAAFADEDEEDKPFDFDNWFKNWCAETFGGAVGDSISRGAASQVTGVNLADRMSLNDMWYRDNRKSPDQETAFQAFLVSLMGPTVGLGVSAFKSLDLANQGHYDRALENITPAVIKNALKATRFGKEGALTLSGDELIPDFSATEIATQALGFSPERLAQKQKANIEMKGAEQEILKKHQDLLNGFFMAVDTGDNDLRERIIDKIIKFNHANPGSAISAASLQASIKRRYQQRALSSVTGGASINKKLIPALQDMGNYGNVEQ